MRTFSQLGAAFQQLKSEVAESCKSQMGHKQAGKQLLPGGKGGLHKGLALGVCDSGWGGCENVLKELVHHKVRTMEFEVAAAECTIGCN